MRYSKVIENQAALSKALSDQTNLVAAVNEARKLVTTLESIHALPIAYVALISELTRRTLFIQVRSKSAS